MALDVLDQVEAALKAATPGPWTVLPMSRHGADPDEGWVREIRQGYDGEMPIGDAALIALLRNHAPALVERCRRAEAVVEAVTAYAEARHGREASNDAAIEHEWDLSVDAAWDDLLTALAAYRGQP